MSGEIGAAVGTLQVTLNVVAVCNTRRLGWGRYRVRKPSAGLTCHRWPSGSVKAPAYPHFWLLASMTILAPASCA